MKIIFNIILILSLFSCGNSQDKHSTVVLKKFVVNGEAQGTYYAITYFADHEIFTKEQFDSILTKYDMSASNYRDSSIISKVNSNIDVTLDSVFLGNFNLAMRVSQESNGEFDITIRPLVELWGFGKKAPHEVSKQEVDSVLNFIGYTKVKIENGKVVKSDSRLQLDFNAIAQGYSVDYIGKILTARGVKIYLVDIGGEVYGMGKKPDGSSWKVGVEQPKDGAEYGESMSAILRIENKGLATSGNYRKYYEMKGEKFSHTISPKDGYPVRKNLLSATVIANSAAEADAYATTFMVIGLEKTKEFLSGRPDLGALLIYSDIDGNFRNFNTKNIEQLIEVQ